MVSKWESQYHSIFRHFLDVLKRCKLPVGIVAKLFNYHHYVMMNDLNKIFKMALNKSSKCIIDNKNKMYSKNIWIFWWQGKSCMPDLVKKCIRSTIKHSSGHKVVLLTKYNLAKYICLPSYVYNKVDKKYITMTEFSDIIRFNLLKNYGGLWVDSTVYCIKDLPIKCFHKLYTASGGIPKYKDNISLGRWTSFLIGGNKGEALFVFMNNLLLQYWKYNNYLIDYFLTDYALNFAYNYNIGGFKKYVISDVVQNPNIYKMVQYLNKPYNQLIYNNLSKNTFLFKLTYKKKIKKNKNTFYYRLISSK